MVISRETINIRRLIAGRNEGLARIMPRFAYRCLERMLHVSELNDVLYRLRDFWGVSFAQGVLGLFGVNVRVSGTEELEQLSRPIVAANHPLGGLDGMALMVAVSEVHPEILVPANDFLLQIPNLAELFVPVNKLGSNAAFTRAVHAAYGSQKALVTFPAGLCSRRKGGRIRDLPWQKSFVSQARRQDRPIVLAHIDGHNSDLFYSLANLRRWFGLGFNLEMLLLVDEMFKQRGRSLHIQFSRPIVPKELDASRSEYEWAQFLRRRVYTHVGAGIPL